MRYYSGCLLNFNYHNAYGDYGPISCYGTCRCALHHIKRISEQANDINDFFSFVELSWPDKLPSISEAEAIHSIEKQTQFLN